jgi:hypothetical protein
MVMESKKIPIKKMKGIPQIVEHYFEKDSRK